MSRPIAIEANCIVPGCHSTKARNPHLEYYPIPQNKEEEWLTIIDRQGLLSEFRASHKCRTKYKICSLHFDDSMIILHRTLSTDATPAFNLPEKNDSENVFLTDKIVQTDNRGSFEKSLLWELNDATFIYSPPLKVTKKRTIGTQTGLQYVSHADINTQCSSNTTPEIIQNPNSELTTEPKEDFENTLTELSAWLKSVKRDFTDKNMFKKFALVLYISCTPLYENIQKSLDLPTVSTLLKWNVEISYEIDRPILNFYLSHKFKLMGNKSKLCILFLDVIDIKPHVYYNITKDKFVGLQQNMQKIKGEAGIKATKAFFMMIRGIHNDWQQFINCFFINEQKSYLQAERINATLKMLAHVGFQVQAIVLDPHPYIYRYAKDLLQINSEKPYIISDSKEVYFMFEPRDLILNLRNLFLENDLLYNNSKISWKYIKDLYLHKEKYKLSILPKLTKAHVFPDERQKMDYKYASEIFSDEICSTLEFYISLSLIPRDALPTARFIRSLSFLIDIFSSNSVNHENELKRAFKMNKQQCSVLLYIQDLIKSLSIIVPPDNKTTKNSDIFDCILITIHSLILLNNSLKTVGISYFMTKRFHGTPLDNLKIKTSNAFKEKVTAVKLLKVMGNQFIRQLIRDKKYYDIPNNLDELYKRAKDIAASIIQLEKKRIHQSNQNSMSLTTKSLNGDFDYRFKLPENNKMTYLSAYLFYKCYKKHRCWAIEYEWSRMESSDDIPWNDCLPLILKGNLRKPTPAFEEIIHYFEGSFLINFVVAKEKPLDNLLTTLKIGSKRYKLVCKCFPMNYLMLLFIRHRIYSVLIHNREIYKQTSSDFMVINRMLDK